ncbi:MAG: tRNA (guanosine(46)-N7)-methyltransferase TrmB, partial [Oscillospiraceae bacterium]|nr:tRNA (guanosine(46)-N7)-methyltransferase TrmB [Oscillospiraceae bacterium]
PWPGKRHSKRRLTADGFLSLYRRVLKDGGEIHFKTDNSELFEFSLEAFAANGFSLHEVTRDLHENGPRGVMTDYERKFTAQGVKINRCVARKEAMQHEIPSGAVDFKSGAPRDEAAEV